MKKENHPRTSFLFSGRDTLVCLLRYNGVDSVLHNISILVRETSKNDNKTQERKTESMITTDCSSINLL